MSNLILTLAQGGSSDFKPFDWHRMFIGDASPWFLLEIAFRTAVMFLFAIVLIRTISRHSVGQLTLLEFLLVVALGSATGDPMFYPDVPIFHGFVVITTIVLINRLLIGLIQRSEAAERIIEGEPLTLVNQGRLLPDKVRQARLNREQVFEFLRLDKIEHLGQVKWAYLEQNGHASVFKQPIAEQTRGLRVAPPWDVEPPKLFATGEHAPRDGFLGCETCGEIREFSADQTLPPCPACHNTRWADAVIQP